MTDPKREAFSALRDARHHVQHAHDEAEALHDNYGDYYMDAGQWEIMQTTEALLLRIDAVLSDSDQ